MRRTVEACFIQIRKWWPSPLIPLPFRVGEGCARNRISRRWRLRQCGKSPGIGCRVRSSGPQVWRCCDSLRRCGGHCRIGTERIRTILQKGKIMEQEIDWEKEIYDRGYLRIDWERDRHKRRDFWSALDGMSSGVALMVDWHWIF